MATRFRKGMTWAKPQRGRKADQRRGKQWAERQPAKGRKKTMPEVTRKVGLWRRIAAAIGRLLRKRMPGST